MTPDSWLAADSAMGGNNTDQQTEFGRALVPEWAASAYLCVTLSGGVASNAALALAVGRHQWRHRSNRRHWRELSELLVLLLHLAVADVGSLAFAAPLEVAVLAGSRQEWRYSDEMCSLFWGMETFFGSATVYLLVTMNLLAVTTRDERGEGEEAEVRNGRAHMPLVLVWLLALSLSVPAWVVAGTVLPRPDLRVCALLDDRHGGMAQALLAILRVVVPVCVMLACSVFTARTMCGDDSGPVARETSRVALASTVSFAALSLFRAVFGVAYVWLPGRRGPDGFKTPPLASVTSHDHASLALSMLHYALCAVRPVVAGTASRQITRVLSSCCCCFCMPRHNSIT